MKNYFFVRPEEPVFSINNCNMGNNNGFRILLCIAIIVAFFLPWLSGGSALDIVKAGNSHEETAVIVFRYSFILVPLFALIILIRSFNKKSSGFFLRLLPLLVTALLTAWVIAGVKYVGATDEQMNSLFKTLGYGYYINAVASLVLLFA